MSMQRLPDDEYDKNHQLDISKLHPYLFSEDGKHRDLSATVSAQNEVIKDLIYKVNKLQKEIERLKESNHN